MYQASNSLYAASRVNKSMTWGTGITIHISAESQRFPQAWANARQEGITNEEMLFGEEWALTGAPAFLHKCVDYVTPTRLRERWLEHFLRQWPD